MILDLTAKWPVLRDAADQEKLTVLWVNTDKSSHADARWSAIPLHKGEENPEEFRVFNDHARPGVRRMTINPKNYISTSLWLYGQFPRKCSTAFVSAGLGIFVLSIGRTPVLTWDPLNHTVDPKETPAVRPTVWHRVLNADNDAFEPVHESRSGERPGTQ